MTINGAITQLVMMTENSMMPNIFRPALNKVIETISELEPEPHWIPCSERLPDELVPVNITWVNHEPVSYYEDIKDKPFSATGIYYRGKWWWYSATAEDVLAEYGKSEFDSVCDSIEIIAWQPLPSPYREEADK